MEGRRGRQGHQTRDVRDVEDVGDVRDVRSGTSGTSGTLGTLGTLGTWSSGCGVRRAIVVKIHMFFHMAHRGPQLPTSRALCHFLLHKEGEPPGTVFSAGGSVDKAPTFHGLSPVFET